MTWKDSRTKSPPTNHYARYAVIFYLKGAGITACGYAGFMPKDGYSKGEWEGVTSTNGNPHDNAEVLYWQEFPPRPEGVAL